LLLVCQALNLAAVLWLGPAEGNCGRRTSSFWGEAQDWWTFLPDWTKVLYHSRYLYWVATSASSHACVHINTMNKLIFSCTHMCMCTGVQDADTQETICTLKPRNNTRIILIYTGVLISP